MSHDNHTTSTRNKELEKYTRDEYLDMTSGWNDPFGLPSVWQHEMVHPENKMFVVRDDLLGVGSKARFGDLLVSSIESDTLVYVAPRVGYAGMSLAHLCKRHGKRLILFAPASKEPSSHQLYACEMGADLIFVRVAAMPNLNRIAREYAKQYDYSFVPFGLDHPLVTASIVRVAHDLAIEYHEPTEVWSVISTGVLSRGLQIGWPNADFKNVAVARNIKDGEKGRAKLYSHPKAFQDRTRVLPPFPSVDTYDAKAWEFVLDWAKPDSWFWNVAGPAPEPRVTCPKGLSSPEWGERNFRDFTLRHLDAINELT